MNINPKARDFVGEPLRPYLTDPAPERAVIGRCMLDHQVLRETISRIQVSDFEEPFHGLVFKALIALVDENRTPSLQAVCAALNGDDELRPGLTVRMYLRDLVSEAAQGFLMPWQDAVEVVTDQARRRELSDIANKISFQSQSAENVGDVASEAVSSLDAVLSALRAGKRQTYDAEGAVVAAIDHFDTSDRVYPTTGLADLDKMCGGFPLGQLTLIGARPGMGKSALATSMAIQTARAGNGLAMFSLEMLAEQLGARMLTEMVYTQIDPIYYEDLLNRRLTDRQIAKLREARSQFKGLPIHIEEQRGLNLSEITARARKIANQFDRDGRQLKVIMIDHLGLVRSSSRYAGNRVQEISEISDGLATLAKDLDVAVVALSQLNRQTEQRENKRPSMGDLRDSGSLEQDASTVIFAYRPAYYLENTKYDDPNEERARLDAIEKTKHKLELIVSKNRNGRQGIVNCFVDIGANVIKNASFGS